MADKTNKQAYILKQYDCGYCKYIFRQYVSKSDKGTDVFKKRIKGSVSSQVICPKCKNGLRTWDDGKVIEEYKHEGRISNRVIIIEPK